MGVRGRVVAFLMCTSGLDEGRRLIQRRGRARVVWTNPHEARPCRPHSPFTKRCPEVRGWVGRLGDGGVGWWRAPKGTHKGLKEYPAGC